MNAKVTFDPNLIARDLAIFPVLRGWLLVDCEWKCVV